MHLAFRNTTKFAAGYYTGGKFPYHLLITQAGTIEQCLPLSYNAPAAMSELNRTGIHIALVGDFRKEAPRNDQEVTLANLCHTLQLAYNWKLEIVGHTDKAGSSSDPNKECPGRKLDLDHLRETLDDERIAYFDPDSLLEEEGIVV
jgi:N-acetyl-anhydromuramyl-L-alanine amidase AmpD